MADQAGMMAVNRAVEALRANLGPGASLLAAASLVVDYTLTVAVSIAAGVASLASAFPSLGLATAPICLAILALITLLNLRGLGAAARSCELSDYDVDAAAARYGPGTRSKPPASAQVLPRRPSGRSRE